MAHFQDLSTCSYFPFTEGLSFIAVGWLEPGYEFNRGNVSKDFFERLCSLLHAPWVPPLACGGVHRCGFCRFTGGGRGSFAGYTVGGMADGFLFIPRRTTLYVSPASIAHYIDAHDYSPPEDFQQAVMACPEMKSMAYKNLLLGTSAREWLKRLASAYAAPE